MLLCLQIMIATFGFWLCEGLASIEDVLEQIPKETCEIVGKHFDKLLLQQVKWITNIAFLFWAGT